jgi:hypothetical protein
MTPARLAIVSLVLVVIGCAIAAVGTAPWLDAVGITVAGVGGVGLVSAAFYGVGESEDRDRARDEAERRGPGPGD